MNMGQVKRYFQSCLQKKGHYKGDDLVNFEISKSYPTKWIAESECKCCNIKHSFSFQDNKVSFENIESTLDEFKEKLIKLNDYLLNNPDKYENGDIVLVEAIVNSRILREDVHAYMLNCFDSYETLFVLDERIFGKIAVINEEGDYFTDEEKQKITEFAQNLKK